jgi:hypothetical protein
MVMRIFQLYFNSFLARHSFVRAILSPFLTLSGQTCPRVSPQHLHQPHRLHQVRELGDEPIRAVFDVFAYLHPPVPLRL